jgi:hypothetical protein
MGSDVSFIKYYGQYFHYVPLQAACGRRFTNEILRPRLVYAVGVRLKLAHDSMVWCPRASASTRAVAPPCEASSKRGGAHRR